ncbi:MAG: 3-hydroxyacyl-ACP dehydratase FabZ [Mariprofundaceae bacterium]|nr:3-hydroxyacyl-ACP dehydratase FabZ [Mariprofundaceae bacterium]
MSAINIDEIMNYLPHRYPFLLVDKVLAFEEDVSIRALKNVTVNEPHFTGHFPDFPVMPGVLIVEAMAQVGGILAFQSAPKDQEFLVYFTGIDGVRFRKPVRPGDQLIFDLTCLRRRGHMWTFKGEAFVDGELVCSGTLMATLMPKDQA